MNQDEQISKEHKRSINKVINYVLKNISGDLSLENLAEVANYSPFHFQKLFKQVQGDSPKQYVMKLRLETAVHSLLIHQHKSIAEIAGDCGFSSPSAFSRAFRSHFELSAEEVRLLPKKQLHLLHKKMQFKFEHDMLSEKAVNEIQVQIKKINAFQGIHLMVPFGDVKKIEQSFKDTYRIAETNELEINESSFCGILNPHQGLIYKTVVIISKGQKIPGKIFTSEIKAGKYATIKVKGDFKNTLEAGKYFFHEWLPRSDCKVTDTVVFELFLQSPISATYKNTERLLCFPIECV